MEWVEDLEKQKTDRVDGIEWVWRREVGKDWEDMLVIMFDYV